MVKRIITLSAVTAALCMLLYACSSKKGMIPTAPNGAYMGSTGKLNVTLGDPAYTNNIQALIQTQDSGFFLTGYSYTSSNTELFGLKTDANGQMKWETYYIEAYGTEGHGALDDAGNIIIGGLSSMGGLFLKLDANGNCLQAQSYNLSQFNRAPLNAVAKTQDGGYALAGYVDLPYNGDNTGCLLLKTDANGNCQWAYSYGSYYRNEAYAIVNNSGEYMLAGMTESSGNGYEDIMLADFNSGGFQWSKAFGTINNETTSTLYRTSDNYLLMPGITINSTNNFQIYIVKTDMSGNLIWQKTIDPAVQIVPIMGSFASCGTLDNGCTYIISSPSSMAQNNYSGMIYVIKIDPSGNKQWTRSYFFGSVIPYAVSALQTNDGGYALAGQYFNGSSGAGLTGGMFLMRFDSSGNQVW